MGVYRIQTLAQDNNEASVREKVIKRLEILGCKTKGPFTVELDLFSCTTPLPSNQSSIKRLNVLHHSEFPVTSFSILDSGHALVSHHTFDTILRRMKDIYKDRNQKIEVKGKCYQLGDFMVRIGMVVCGGSSKGSILEFEYMAGCVPDACWPLMREMMTCVMESPSLEPHPFMQPRMNEVSTPLHLMQQYNEQLLALVFGKKGQESTNNNNMMGNSSVQIMSK